MLAVFLAPLIFFLGGFLFGYVMSRLMISFGSRLLVGALLWLPIVALLLLQYTEVIDPDALSDLLIFTPRVIKYPVIGFLVGYSFETILAAARR